MNKITGYTPGPWEAYEVLNGVPHTEIREENFGTLKAQFFGEDHRKNAVLCAAAPELLAALERVLECRRLRISLDTNAGAVEQARAAIAKAKGVK